MDIVRIQRKPNGPGRPAKRVRVNGVEVSETAASIYRLLRTYKGVMDVPELARALKVSQRRVNQCLVELQEKGLVVGRRTTFLLAAV